MKLRLSNASSVYGSSMGRRDMLPADTSAGIKLSLRKLYVNAGGYDAGGAYWGAWSPAHGGMWVAYGHDANGDAVQVFVRAHNRPDAAEIVRAGISGAMFRGIPRYQAQIWSTDPASYAWRVQFSDGTWTGWHGGYTLRIDAEDAARSTL